MKDYQYILFDWDGTIAQTDSAWRRTQEESFKKFGINDTAEGIFESFNGTVAYLQHKHGFEKARAQQVLDNTKRLMVESAEAIELYPNVLETLQQLKSRGKKLAVVTSSFRDVFQSQLELHNLNELFDVTITSDDVKECKPAAEPLIKALELLEGKPEQAIMIGDTDKDILGGKNAGVDTVLSFPSDHIDIYDRNVLEAFKPTYIIEDFRELLTIIK